MNKPVSSSERSPSAQAGSISSTLLDRVRAQRPEAWERLVDLFGPSVYRWCRRWGVGPEDTADLVQEVFAAVASHVAGFRRNGSGGFTAWLATITRNKIRDHFRRQGNRPRAQGGTDAREQIEQLPDPIEPSEIAEAQRSLPRRGLELVRAEFENRTWEAFWHTTVNGRPPTDVADELGMTLAAVYKAKSRVLRRLRQELGGLMD